MILLTWPTTANPPLDSYRVQDALLVHSFTPFSHPLPQRAPKSSHRRNHHRSRPLPCAALFASGLGRDGARSRPPTPLDARSTQRLFCREAGDDGHRCFNQLTPWRGQMLQPFDRGAGNAQQRCYDDMAEMLHPIHGGAGSSWGRCCIRSRRKLHPLLVKLHPLPKKASSVTGGPATTSRRCWNRLEEVLQPLPAKVYPLVVVLQPH